MASRFKNKSVSQLVREVIDKFLSDERENALDTIYKGLWELKGIGGKGGRDASATIDEVLYGEYGAWRGSEK